MASSKAPCMQGAHTLLSLTKFGFTCTAKIKEPEVAACNKGDNIGDIGVASAPEIPNGTNASTSVVWGPDDCHSSVRQTTASAATSRGSTAKTASKRAVDTSTNSPTSKKKKLASDCSNNPVSCYRSSCDDFNDTERGMLSTEVELIITEITMATELSEMKMNDMCKWLHTKSGSYPLTQRFYVLVSVLPYSSAACERNFSGLKFVKNRLRSTIGDDFLDDLLTMLVENDLVDAILKADDSDTSFTQAINYFATQFGKRREKM